MQSPSGTSPTSSPFAPPQPPKLLQRGPSFVELSHFSLGGRAVKGAAAFACYCKPVFAGVGLSINRTAMELPGWYLVEGG
jgi:hypothetical protein